MTHLYILQNHIDAVRESIARDKHLLFQLVKIRAKLQATTPPPKPPKKKNLSAKAVDN
jgi:hypothetical protein